MFALVKGHDRVFGTYRVKSASQAASAGSGEEVEARPRPARQNEPLAERWPHDAGDELAEARHVEPGTGDKFDEPLTCSAMMMVGRFVSAEGRRRDFRPGPRPEEPYVG